MNYYFYTGLLETNEVIKIKLINNLKIFEVNYNFAKIFNYY